MSAFDPIPKALHPTDRSASRGAIPSGVAAVVSATNTVREYQLYLFNGSDVLARCEEFRAFNDLCAKLFAENSADAGPMELWSGTRIVERWSRSWTARHERDDPLLLWR